MMYHISRPSHIDTVVQLPASKSISNRVLILNALCKECPYPIENLSDSDDTQVMLDAFDSKKSLIDVGAAGTSMRFLTAYFSQKEGIWSITGTERMKNRPIYPLVEALSSVGADIEYIEKKGFPPLKIKGRRLKGGKINLKGDISSQYISALLMIAPYMDQGLTIHLDGEIISSSYIQMTIGLMKQYGVQVQWEDKTIIIPPQIYSPTPFRVESDWSAASYWNEIEMLEDDNFRIKLLGLDDHSLQGDANQISIFEKLKSHSCQIPFTYNFVNEPDLAQTFIVTACLLDIPFFFDGLQSLRIKETDRITAMQNEMKKLGYILKVTDRSVAWRGEKVQPDEKVVIDTYDDHRMAMAFAPACLKMQNIYINNPEVVSKSYPNYWEDLQMAGFIIKEVE
ncbi:3-phosphoshikimate 1-carboxyvinyltransferase [Bacteroidales bacterium OttesenSCG-928-M11]|nr:3-phosphoshikimate 1-carboxyvinyltransferase [Bacteroidales bacterium OttesenSCG-928-M11]